VMLLLLLLLLFLLFFRSIEDLSGDVIRQVVFLHESFLRDIFQGKVCSVTYLSYLL